MRGEVKREFVRDEAGASAPQLLPAQRWEAASRLDTWTHSTFHIEQLRRNQSSLAV